MPGISQVERNRRDRLYEDGLKQCTQCAETLGVESFEPQSDGYKGLTGACRLCRRKASADYRKRTPEKQSARQKRWRDANPDRSHAIAKRYRDSHREAEKVRKQRQDDAEVARMIAKLDALEARWISEESVLAQAAAEEYKNELRMYV